MSLEDFRQTTCEPAMAQLSWHRSNTTRWPVYVPRFRNYVGTVSSPNRFQEVPAVRSGSYRKPRSGRSPAAIMGLNPSSASRSPMPSKVCSSPPTTSTLSIVRARLAAPAVSMCENTLIPAHDRNLRRHPLTNGANKAAPDRQRRPPQRLT